MKLTLADIFNAWEPLVKLSEKDLPIKTAFKVGKILKVISDERQLIENQRVALFKKYGGPDENNPDKIMVPPEKMEALLSEWNDFLMQDTDVDIEPLDTNFINEISFVNMTGRDMAFIFPFMKEFEEIAKSSNKKD